MRRQAGYRWFGEGSLAVPAVWVDERTVVVSLGVAGAGGVAAGGVGVCARVCSGDQRAELDREGGGAIGVGGAGLDRLWFGSRPRSGPDGRVGGPGGAAVG